MSHSWEEWVAHPWMAALARGKHQTEIIGGPGTGRWGARCKACPWTTGQHFTSREQAKQASEGHLAFTNPQSQRNPFEGLTPAEKLAYRAHSELAQALRRVGAPSPEIELRPAGPTPQHADLT